MLAKFLPSPVLILDCRSVSFSQPDPAKFMIYGSSSPFRNLKFRSAAGTQDAVVCSEWEACKQALYSYGLETDEEQELVLNKAFGFIHSSYWGEERKQQLPDLDSVTQILSYLKGLGLSHDELSKLFKKFPEVLGCNLDNELKVNVQILEKQWGIEGKSLKKLLLRNPRVLGYTIDCKGDCQALCTRCWARF